MRRCPGSCSRPILLFAAAVGEHQTLTQECRRPGLSGRNLVNTDYMVRLRTFGALNDVELHLVTLF